MYTIQARHTLKADNISAKLVEHILVCLERIPSVTVDKMQSGELRGCWCLPTDTILHSRAVLQQGLNAIL